jgi:hypothetical protein
MRMVVEKSNEDGGQAELENRQKVSDRQSRSEYDSKQTRQQ